VGSILWAISLESDRRIRPVFRAISAIGGEVAMAETWKIAAILVADIVGPSPFAVATGRERA
jgi:hypothetical protein